MESNESPVPVEKPARPWKAQIVINKNNPDGTIRPKKIYLIADKTEDLFGKNGRAHLNTLVEEGLTDSQIAEKMSDPNRGVSTYAVWFQRYVVEAIAKGKLPRPDNVDKKGRNLTYQAMNKGWVLELSPEEQVAVMLKYGFSLIHAPHKEIARLLEIPESSVSEVISSGLQKLENRNQDKPAISGFNSE